MSRPPAGGRAGGARTSLARSGAVNVVATGAGAVGQLGFTLLVTRAVPVADAGVLFVATSIFLLLLGVVDLGTEQGVVRHLAAHRARRAQGEDLRADDRAVMRWSASAVLGSGLVLAAAGTLLAEPLAALAGEADQRDLLADLLRVMLPVLPLAAAFQLLLGATRGAGTMRPTVLLDRIARSGLPMVGAVVAVAVGAGAAGLALAWVLPYALLLPAAWWFWRRAREVPALPVVARALTPSGYWAYTVPRGVARLGQIALQRLDIILVGSLAGVQAAAVYAAATRFVVLGQLANQAIQQVVQAPMAGRLATGRTRAAESLLRHGTTWFVALAWPFYLSLAVLAPVALPLFGSDYALGVDTVRILAVGLMVATAFGPLDVALVMSGRSVTSMVNTFAALAVDVVLCLLLVPTLEGTGAAIAWAVAMAVRNALGALQVRSDPGLSPWSRPLALTCVLAVVVTGGPGVVALVLGAGGWALVGIQALSCVAYAGIVLHWRRALTIDELLAGLSGRTPRTPVNGAHDA